MSSRISLRYATLMALPVLCGTLAVAAPKWPSLKTKPRAAAPKGATYDRMFPYYVESCAETRSEAKGGGKGGPFGHAVIYVKGLCRDEKAELPQVKLCDPSSDITNPDTGVGVSVNKEFRNINFQIIPKKSLFFYGGLDPSANLTRQLRDGVTDANKDLFANVKLHEKYMEGFNPAWNEADTRRFVAKHSIDTDFALGFARQSSCALIPIKKEMLMPLAAFLNDLNRKYFYGGKDYNWEGTTNNCTHLTHNAVASMGFIPPVPTDDNTVESAVKGQMEAPANEFIAIMELTNNRDFDVLRDFKDDYIRQTFLTYRWLPTQHGALLDFVPGMQNNDVYEVTGRVDKLPGCLVSSGCAQAVPWLRWSLIHHLARYNDIKANLEYFQTKYAKALVQRLPRQMYKVPASQRELFNNFYTMYFDYLQAQFNDVQAKLKALR